MFCREAVIWKRLSHPNLVPFLGVNKILFNLALVSEWMEHGTILRFVKNYPETNRLKLVCILSLPRTTSTNQLDTQIHDVASGLEYLHDFPFVHSDLKGVRITPFILFLFIEVSQRNILVDGNSNACICDFGLTDVMSTASISLGTPPTGGTRPWMAPEQLRGGKSTKESDVYSFGMVAYEVSITIVSRVGTE